MSKSEIYPGVALRAAELFGGDEEVYSIPLNYPFPYPRAYVAYDLGAAAFDAMVEAGYDMIDVRKQRFIIGMRSHIEEAVKELVEDWEETLKHREIQARLLNAYSSEGSFNPN